MKRFEVIGIKGQLLGYVYGSDIDHAYSIACSQYTTCRFYIIGPGCFAAMGEGVAA